MSTCRSCGDPITWAKTATGKLMPLDRMPTVDGNIEIVHHDQGTPVVRVHADPNQASLTSEHRYTSHFATCEHADEWRKR